MHARRTAGVATAMLLATACTGTTAVVIAVGRAASTPPTGRSPSPAAAPTAGVTTTTNPPADLTVNGSRIPSVDNNTVASALAAAGITLRPGRYLSVVGHRPLRSDGRPARIFVDHVPATLTAPVAPGDSVLVQPGRDLIEPTRTTTERLSATVPSALYVGSRPGVVRVLRGTISHEVVARRIVRAPKVGHLVRPGAVALTFDDGPALGYTQTVLAMLARHHVKATFCLIGAQAAAHPRLVRQIDHAGHALCDHTWDHDLDLRARPKAQIALDIHRGERAIKRATDGDVPTFFRAPGGNWSPRMERLARKQGLVPLKWTVDPRDWARPGKASILRTVYAELRPGGVILMHDGGGNRSETIAALRVLLRRLPKMGYHFVIPPVV